MLKDRPRQAAYRDAILSNRSLFEGKTVMDVGAGTGILSIFCAQAGAKKVYAVEASNIAQIARQIVKENGFESIIEVYQQKIEEFQLPASAEDAKVDIIVSEWMGFYLLHEGMLDSVIYARDQFLVENGTLFPNNASISVAPCRVPTRFDDWNDVDGVRMTSLGAAIRTQKSYKPEVLNVPADCLLHDGTVVAWLDLNDISIDDLNQFQFKEVIVIQQRGRYQGVCLWFDVEFPSNDDDDMVTLSTHPKSLATHWKQTVILLPENAHEDVDERDPIAFELTIRRNESNSRHYNLEVTLIDQELVEHSLPCDCIQTKCILTKAHLASVRDYDFS